MKVLVVHPGVDFSVSDVHDGLIAGLRANGVDVGELNLNDMIAYHHGAHLEKNGEWVPAVSSAEAMRLASQGIEVAAGRWWPDVVLIVSGFFVAPETWAVLARRPWHVVLWCTESPYEDDRQMNPARYADTVVINDPRNIEAFRAINGRTWYFPHSYDPARHFPGPADHALMCDFGFVGTGFPSRIDFFEKVDWAGIDARFGGNWQQLRDDSPLLPMLLDERGHCMDNADTARLYRSAKVNANLYRKETSDRGDADGWAMGPREVELAACGSFFLREPRGEGDELFPMLPKFGTPAEFEDQLRWWLAHPSERESAAAAARQAVSDRTFEATAARLLRLVDGAPTQVR